MQDSLNMVPQNLGDQVQREQDIGMAKGLFKAEQLVEANVLQLKQDIDEAISPSSKEE